MVERDVAAGPVQVEPTVRCPKPLMGSKTSVGLEENSMEPAIVIAAFGAIAAWLELSLRERTGDREQRDAAVEAIYKAAVATRAYVAQVEPPRGRGHAPPDPDEEEELAQLWMTAGVQLGAIDLELADKCAVKSGYWIEPEPWTETEISTAATALDTIIDRASVLRGPAR